jgi:hypothetical protein
MLKESAAILEFYRLQADNRERTQAGGGAPVSAPFVRLQAPTSISAVHGLSGSYYVVDADRGIAVREEDVPALLDAGFERVPRE